MSSTLSLSSREGAGLFGRAILPGMDAARARTFVLGRLALGAAGLVATLSYLAWRGAASPADVLLGLGLCAPLAAAFAGYRDARPEVAYGLSAVGVAALVLCVFTSAEHAAWPAAIWLVAQPLNAFLSGSRPAALASGMVSAVAFAAVAAGGLSGPLPFQPGYPAAIASAFLIAAALVEGAAGVVARRRLAAIRPPAPAPAAVDERLLAGVGDLVTWHDRNGDVTRAAGAAAQLAGCATPDLRGTGFFERVHIPDRPAYLKALSDAATGLGPVRVEFRLQTADGTAWGASRLLPVEMRALALDAAGERPAVVAFTRDASAVESSRAEIEAARLEAERASDMKGRFLATVSHELRTPLNAIIGFSELLSAEHPYVMAEERRKEYAVIIRDSGHHLLEVVNTLLDISKIESGNFAFSPEPFSLADLTSGCCDLMRLKAEGAGVRLVSRIAPDLPDIVADRRACRQILINLLSNAVKFTPARGTVTIALSRDGDRATMTVSDDGIGIREADLPRLGDPFFQAGDLHRRPHEGTGLGLSVVRGLVGLHGGAMAIDSGPGAGTAVTVSLPLSSDAAAGQNPPVTVRFTARRPIPEQERKSA